MRVRSAAPSPACHRAGSAPRRRRRTASRCARPVGVAVVSTNGTSGWRARSARTSAAAAETSPTDTACSQMLGTVRRSPQPEALAQVRHRPDPPPRARASPRTPPAPRPRQDAVDQAHHGWARATPYPASSSAHCSGETRRAAEPPAIFASERCSRSRLRAAQAAARVCADGRDRSRSRGPPRRPSISTLCALRSG